MYALAFGVHDPEIGPRPSLALVGGAAIPLDRLGGGIALVGGAAIPLHRLGVLLRLSITLRHAPAFGIHRREGSQDAKIDVILNKALS